MALLFLSIQKQPKTGLKRALGFLVYEAVTILERIFTQIKHTKPFCLTECLVANLAFGPSDSAESPAEWLSDSPFDEDRIGYIGRALFNYDYNMITL